MLCVSTAFASALPPWLRHTSVGSWRSSPGLKGETAALPLAAAGALSPPTDVRLEWSHEWYTATLARCLHVLLSFLPGAVYLGTQPAHCPLLAVLLSPPPSMSACSTALFVCEGSCLSLLRKAATMGRATCSCPGTVVEYRLTAVSDCRGFMISVLSSRRRRMPTNSSAPGVCVCVLLPGTRPPAAC